MFWMAFDGLSSFTYKISEILRESMRINENLLKNDPTTFRNLSPQSLLSFSAPIDSTILSSLGDLTRWFWMVFDGLFVFTNEKQ